MKPLFQILIFSLALGVVLASCDPCANLDCAAGKLDRQFEIISATTGQNLVFGPGKTYDTSQIRFFATKGRDTTYFRSYIYSLANRPADTALQVSFYPNTDTAYIRLSPTDTDTLTFSFKSYNTKCCGKLTDITSVRYNAMQAMTNQGVVEVRK